MIHYCSQTAIKDGEDAVYWDRNHFQFVLRIFVFEIATIENNFFKINSTEKLNRLT
jgi:hypothetical protein